MDTDVTLIGKIRQAFGPRALLGALGMLLGALGTLWKPFLDFLGTLLGLLGGSWTPLERLLDATRSQHRKISRGPSLWRSNSEP